VTPDELDRGRRAVALVGRVAVVRHILGPSAIFAFRVDRVSAAGERFEVAWAGDSPWFVVGGRDWVGWADEVCD
jgi:hypothetical protein